MPILASSEEEEYIEVPAQQVPVTARADVLVVGGGPAGIAAAVGAARAGMDVILVERYGFLGGNATAALVMPLMSFHTQYKQQKKSGDFRLWPEDHGPGVSVISGVLEEFLAALVADGGAIPPSEATGFVVPFDPEMFKWTALKMLDDAGVRMLFHSLATDVFRDSSGLQGVIFQTKSGPIAIHAKVTVDGTGDGDIAFRAGASYDLGRSLDGLMQPMTLMFRMVEFERTTFQEYVREHPDQWRGVHGLWDLVRQASENGELDLAREDLLFFATPHEKEVSVNSTRVTGVSGVSVWDLSRAEYLSRRQMYQIVAFLRKYVPGFERAYAAQSGTHIGVRESRRITGEYHLTGEDIFIARKFPDVIARSTYPVDIHNPEGKGTVLKNIPLGEAYDIPLGCLIPRDVERLLVAGRCISGTHVAHSSYRVMPVCMATGHAAGVAAALSVKGDVAVRSLPVEKVQKELLRQGANLG